MGGKAGIGRRLWVTMDADGSGDVNAWTGRPEWYGRRGWWTPGQGQGCLSLDPLRPHAATDLDLRPGECIELREVRRTKGGDE